MVLSRPGGVGGVDRASSSDVRGSNPLSENNPSLPKAWPTLPQGSLRSRVYCRISEVSEGGRVNKKNITFTTSWSFAKSASEFEFHSEAGAKKCVSCHISWSQTRRAQTDGIHCNATCIFFWKETLSCKFFEHISEFIISTPNGVIFPSTYACFPPHEVWRNHLNVPIW